MATVKELKAIAKEMGLKNYSKLRKAELIALIEENSVTTEVEEVSTDIAVITEEPTFETETAIATIESIPTAVVYVTETTTIEAEYEIKDDTLDVDDYLLWPFYIILNIDTIYNVQQQQSRDKFWDRVGIALYAVTFVLYLAFVVGVKLYTNRNNIFQAIVNRYRTTIQWIRTVSADTKLMYRSLQYGWEDLKAI